MPFLGWLDSITAGTPRWLQRGWGGALVRSLAVTLDAATETTKQAVKARFPSYAPPDALTLLGEERQSVRATAVVYEDDRAFADRLRTLWDHAQKIGSKRGLTYILGALGFTSSQVKVHDLGEWQSSLPKHVWIVLDEPHPWGPGPVLGDGWTLGDGSTLGSSATVAQVQNVRAVTAPWVPPHRRTYLVFATLPAPLLGSGWTLGDGTTLSDPGLCAWRLGKGTLT